MFPGLADWRGVVGDRQQPARESDTHPGEQMRLARSGQGLLHAAGAKKSTSLAEQLDFGKLMFSRETYPWRGESRWVPFTRLASPCSLWDCNTALTVFLIARERALCCFWAAKKIKQHGQGERRKEKISACKLGPSITVKIGLLPQSILTGCKVHRTRAFLTLPATRCVLNRERMLPAVLPLTLWIQKIPLKENHCVFMVCIFLPLPSPKQAIAWRNGDFLPGSFEILILLSILMYW